MSESAEGQHRTRTVPRWVLEAWLWVTVPVALYEQGPCPIEWDSCRAITDPIMLFLFDLFPGEASTLFQGMGAGKTGAAVLTVALAVVCHLLLRRFVAQRVRLPLFIGLYAIALGLAAASAVIGVSLGFDVPPWLLLRGMFGR